MVSPQNFNPRLGKRVCGMLNIFISGLLTPKKVNRIF